MGGPTSVPGPACMVLGMQTSSWLPMASLGQTITTHQGKQLGVTKISSPCDCAPMFGLLHPNLTHFVHTIEANWGHALQFCRAPPSISNIHPTCRRCAPDMLSPVWAEARRGSNEQENWGTMENMLLDGETNEHHGVEALALKIPWMCINLRSHNKS